MLIRLLGPGDFTGETSVFTGQRPDQYATAAHSQTSRDVESPLAG